MGSMGLQTLSKPEISFHLCHDCWGRHLSLCPQGRHLWGGPSWDPVCFKLHLLLLLHWPGVQIPSSFSFFPKAAPDLSSWLCTCDSFYLSLHVLLILGGSVAEPLPPLNSLPVPRVFEGHAVLTANPGDLPSPN